MIKLRAHVDMAESNSVKYGGLRSSLVKLGLLLLLASFCGVVLLVNAALTWWMLLILALPAYLVSDWLGEKVFAPKYGWSTAQVGFSPKRIALGVLVVLAVSSLVYLVLKLFQ